MRIKIKSMEENNHFENERILLLTGKTLSEVLNLKLQHIKIR
jgi:hypothetical protein